MRDLSLLKGLIPDRFFVALSPSDWERERGKLISEAQDKHRILCLFDQDLSMADLPGRSGMMLIQQILETQKQDCFVICGLLTQTLRKDDEITKAREMAAEFGLHLDQFLPLSKDRLRSDPMDFANGLKMILLNFVREQLSNQVVKLTDQANREAQRQTNEIDVYDFERIVVQSSEQEGIWEPDTLFRLFELFRYSSFKALMLEAEKRTLFCNLIEQIRAIRNVKTSDELHQGPSEAVCKIRQIELYDSADSLNRAHQPIDLGDIFEVGNGHYYILLAQPCDLMVRNNGKRGLDIGNLVKVRTLEDDQLEPEKISSFYLAHFESNSTKKTFVKFRNSLQISLSVLDLAVFNENGQCRISLHEEDKTKHPLLHAPWRKRLTHLQRQYRNTNSEFANIHYLQVSDYEQEALRKNLTCSNKDIDLNYDDGIFEFGIHRVRKLRSPLSVELLSAYYSFLSRNPQEHDFAR